MAPPNICEIIIWIAEARFCLKFPESLNKTPRVTAPLKWQPHTGDKNITMHIMAKATVAGSLFPAADIFTVYKINPVPIASYKQIKPLLLFPFGCSILSNIIFYLRPFKLFDYYIQKKLSI